MKTFFAEFKTFALRGNVVDLAVGVVIGAAFATVTTSLVTNVLTPPIGLLMGGIDFSKLSVTLGGEAVVGYGLFLQAILNFLITALALFLFIRFINRLVSLARKEQAKGTAPDNEKSAELQVLEEIRDMLKNKQA